MKLKTIFKLIQLEKLMATIEQNTALIAEIAASVQANTDIIDGIKQNTAKIFDEVQRLVAAANVEIPGLAELRQATIDQAAVLAQAAAANTAVDDLIPDAEVVVEAPVVTGTDTPAPVEVAPVVEEPAIVDPSLAA